MSTTTDEVDVRGPRFAAWITTAVLVLTLLVSAVSAPAAAVILGGQAAVFAISALRGPRHSPYGLLFANLVAPRLGPVTEREPVPPLKFAQVVGLAFASMAGSTEILAPSSALHERRTARLRLPRSESRLMTLRRAGVTGSPFCHELN